MEYSSTTRDLLYFVRLENIVGVYHSRVIHPRWFIITLTLDYNPL